MPYLPHPLYRGIPRYGEYYIHPKQGMVTNWRDERPSPHQGTLFPPGTGTMGSQDPSNKHRHMRWKTINKMTRDDGKIPHGRGWTDAKTNTATTLYQSDIPYPRLADLERSGLKVNTVSYDYGQNRAETREAKRMAKTPGYFDKDQNMVFTGAVPERYWEKDERGKRESLISAVSQAATSLPQYAYDAPLEGSSPSRLSSQFVQPQLPFEEG